MKSFFIKIHMLLMLIMTLTILQGNAQCIYRMDFDRSYNLPPEGGMMNVMLFGDYNAVESAGYEIRYSNGTRDRGSAGVENGIVSIMVYPYNGPTDYNARITVSVYSYSRPECNYEETLYFSHQGVPSFTPGTIGSNQTIPSDTQPARLINTASGSSGVSYRWQQSLNGYSFTDITGATAVDYQPPVLNATTYYRRQATFSGYAKYSNTVTVTVTVDPSSFSPSNENYIITFSPYTAQTTAKIRTAKNSIVSMVYYDGLGRPMQQVAVNGASAGKDMVVPITYDDYGREEKSYLPYERGATRGVYTSTAVADQRTFYTGIHGTNDANYAFTQKQFEQSPLNRVMRESAPGYDWRLNGGHDNSLGYTANIANEVKLWTVSGNALSQSGTYAAAQLYVTEVTNPDGEKVREFKDKQDKLIEKWQIDKSNAANKLVTSYVYDEYNDLRVVIPPKAQSLAVNGTEFNSLVYRYTYDSRGRMIEKKLPDSETQYFVYDSRDRLVLFQDGVLRTSGKWKYTLYDNLNRPVVEGHINTSLSRDLLQSYYKSTFVNQTRTNANYNLATVSGVPALTATTLISQIFYDNYDGDVFGYSTVDFAMGAPVRQTSVKGQVAFTKIKVLDNNENTSSAKTVHVSTYYDNKYRAIQVKRDLFDGNTTGKSTISTNFAFDGNPERIREKQVFYGQINTANTRYTYDHARRPVDIYHRMNSAAEWLISTTTYDGIGRAKTKKMGNNELVNYAYNIRSWLTEIKSPKFETQLYYNTGLPSGATALWNGNITAATWKQNGGSQQNYKYMYDGFSRITQGIHSGGRNESGITYDTNGNITKLVRAGGTNPGTYNYVYSGNRLASLNGSTYEYDANGNTTKDGLRNFAVSYNLLNLPKKVSKGGDYVEYVYLANGEKLAKKKNGQFVNFYCGSFVYKGNMPLEYVAHSEGLALKNGSLFDYQYNLTDHLGNVRNVLNASATSIQSNDYYPFGLTHNVVNNFAKNKYLYNSKEAQDETIGGTIYNVLDYGARLYDPVLGIMGQVDPLAEKNRRWGTYTYCFNNPLRFIDPDGMAPSTHTDEEGNVVAIYDDGDLGVYLHAGNTEEAKKHVDENYSEGNTSAGGEKMGETWTSLSFADFDHYETSGGEIKIQEGAKIDFFSHWATNAVQEVLDKNPTILGYALKARQYKPYDIKSNAKDAFGSVGYGSKLYGKYASARDAGNFLAGAMAEKSLLPNFITNYGFGVYNQSGNNVSKSGILILSDIYLVKRYPGTGMRRIRDRAINGENPLTQQGVKAGREYIKNNKQ